MGGTCSAIFFGSDPEIFISWNSNASKQKHSFPVFCKQLSLGHSGAQTSPTAPHCLPKLRNLHIGCSLWDMEGQALGEVLYVALSQLTPKAALGTVYDCPHLKMRSLKDGRELQSIPREANKS